MRLLLDTHTLLWWTTGDKLLSERARKRIAQSQEPIIISAVSAWEIAIKVNLGRLPAGATELIRDFEQSLKQDGFQSMSITADHGIRAGLLPGPDKDPFDRMLIAQAQAENLTIVSNDRVFDRYGVNRIW
ncbi:MAG TPA: type II toxin-antitoxin system VapC family toxin [Terriglobales bacterium]|nr:type II toxin-antitoxin system VapC family toxin [Terriglobales bacterium]